MIYFVQCGPDGPIKIGCTAGLLVTRLRQLQGTSPHELVILGAHEGDREVEQALHRRFAKTNVRAEWFHPSPELVEYIGSIPGGPLASYRKAERFDIRSKICREAQRTWTAETRREFRSIARQFKPALSRWREGCGPFPEHASEPLKHFLAHRVQLLPEAAK